QGLERYPILLLCNHAQTRAAVTMSFAIVRHGRSTVIRVEVRLAPPVQNARIMPTRLQPIPGGFPWAEPAFNIRSGCSSRLCAQRSSTLHYYEAVVEWIFRASWTGR